MSQTCVLTNIFLSNNKKYEIELHAKWKDLYMISTHDFKNEKDFNDFIIDGHEKLTNKTGLFLGTDNEFIVMTNNKIRFEFKQIDSVDQSNHMMREHLFNQKRELLIMSQKIKNNNITSCVLFALLVLCSSLLLCNMYALKHSDRIILNQMTNNFDNFKYDTKMLISEINTKYDNITTGQLNNINKIETYLGNHYEKYFSEKKEIGRVCSYYTGCEVYYESNITLTDQLNILSENDDKQEENAETFIKNHNDQINNLQEETKNLRQGLDTGGFYTNLLIIATIVGRFI